MKFYRKIKPSQELLKEIYQLFKDLDLFSAHSFEEFSAKAAETTQLHKVFLVDILKSFRNARPQSPAISMTPLNPVVQEIYNQYQHENEPDLNVGGLEITTSKGESIDLGKSEYDASNVQYFYDEPEANNNLIYDENALFYFDEDDNIQTKQTEQIIELEKKKEEQPFIVHFEPSSINYWDSTRIWLPYPLIYYVRNYWSRFLEMMEEYYSIPNFENADLDELIYLFMDTQLIQIISYNPNLNSHVLKMNKLIFTIHEMIKSEAGEKRPRK